MFSVKKCLSIIISIIMLVGLFAGCGGSAPASPPANDGGSTAPAADSSTGSAASSGDKIALSFWSLNTRQPAIEAVIREFNEVNSDIVVTASFYDTDGIKDACKIAASSGTLPSMWFNWGGSLGGFYSDNGLTYDLTNYAKEHNWDNIFTAGVLDLVTRDGKVTGYPTSFNALAPYYRVDIFQQLGLSIPTTLEEFEAVCAELKANGITPITTAGQYGWHLMRFVELLIEHYAGAELHDAMNEFRESYDNPAVTQAFIKYKEFVDLGYFPEGFLTASPEDTRLAMFTGTAAMDIQGPWYDSFILQDGQDMSRFGVFAFPSGGSNRLSAFAEMVQFNANLTEAELAASVEFIDFYYSDEMVNKYIEYYNLPLPKVGQPMPEGMPNVPVMLNLANNNGTFTITDQAFPTEVADALFDVQDAIALGQMDPSEGGARIQAAIESYLASN